MRNQLFSSLALLVSAAVFSPASAVDDLLGGSPLSDVAPNLAFLDHPKPPNPSFWGDVQGPYQTNSWWENLVLDDGDQPVSTLPFLLKTLEDGVHVCMPEKTVNTNAIVALFEDTWTLGASEPLGSRAVADNELLSVKMVWEGGLDAPLVQGMAYVTVNYQGLTPKLSTVENIVSVNGGTGPVMGSRFEVVLDNGQTWIFYSSSEMSLTPSGSSLVASGVFDGSMRAAVVIGSVNAADLDAFSSAIPISGSVSASSSGDTATYTFSWEKSGTGDLLMMALPHHLDILSSPQLTDISYNTIKGDMIGVVGDSWSLVEDLTTVDFFSPQDIDASKIEDIRAALNEDTAFEVVSTDPYFGGKQMAAIARLALIADELGETALASTFIEKVKPTLQSWLEATNVDPLVYDQTWGGLVTINGLYDSQADFGQGYYNDHHFHYGYHIFTAAVIARVDQAWADQYDEMIVTMIRDISEPSGSDPYFTQTRSKDWFAGHGWANGIQVAFETSHNQESTSESANAWYGVYLYGLATGNDRVKDLGRLQLATEIRSTHKYWQIMAQDDIYSPPFTDNKVVGILWSTKVDYTTWFGSNIEFIHCIQMLPFVPMTEQLLRPEWIQEEYPVLEQAFDTADEAWRGYIIMAHAIIDKEAAWQEAAQLTRYDDGNTKSNTLYWIATRA